MSSLMLKNYLKRLTEDINLSNNRVFIIHGWGGSPNEKWIKWLGKELEKKNINVSIPLMPSKDRPKINEWVTFLKNKIGTPNENLFFVGHSIGCQAIIRYLESLPYNIKIGGAVFVAGWFHLKELDSDEEIIANPWIATPINYNKVKEKTDNFIAIFSTNDPVVPITDANIFKNKLGAEIIIEKNKGHFDEEDGIFVLPSALKSILKLLKIGKR
jgi:predicted alpha/beta hydrolase family esterase